MRFKVLFVSLAVALFVLGQAFGQDGRVSGRVISSEDRDPLIGVNIVVAGTDMGTTTDSDGRYLLDGVSPDATLVFSYIGYQTEEISVAGRQEIDVVMTPQALPGEELVVIGYGTQQRRDITSSITSLKEGSFTQGATTDIQSLLQARVPGVVVTSNNGEVGGEPLIRIRGGTSVTASNNPMIVIDGVPVNNTSALPGGTGEDINDGPRDNPLGMLNPRDIASIDILKDASAAAIYGARGGNGVILITTKEGSPGVPGGPSLVYDVYTSSSSVSNKLDLMSASEYKAYAQKVANIIDDTTKFVYDPDDFGTANTDWQDAIFRTAISQNHNISFTGGSAATQYRASLNYLDEQGVVLNSARQRYSGRLNVNHRMLDNKLKLALRINPSFIRRHNTPYNQRAGYFGGVFTNVLKMNPTYPVKNDDGSYYEYPTTTIRNPVALLNEISDVSEEMRIFFNSTAEYEFIPGLNGKLNVGLDRTAVTRNTYQPRELPYAEAFGGRADIRTNERQSVLFESTLNYRASMGASNLEATGGYTFQEFEDEGVGITARDFVTDAWLTDNIGGAADFTTRPYSFRNVNRLISFLGRANVNVAGKYLISGAVRREGSSRFGEGNKWGIFPSASFGWRLSREPFMPTFGVLSDLKVRASFGITGNQDIGNYRSLVLLGPGSNTVIGDQLLTGVAPTQLANPDLKWEETSQLNLGIDFGLYRDRVSGSIDVYSKTTNDLLLEFDVAQPAVVTTRLDNVGTVENKGIEIALNTVNISTEDLFWRTSFNFATNRNEVTSLGEDTTYYIVTGDVGGAGLSGVKAQIVRIGEPLGAFFGFKFLGYDDDGQEILTTEGGPLDDGRFILGSAQPDFTFGISNIINYGNIDISVFFQGVWGNEIMNNTRLEYERPSNVTNDINLFSGAEDYVDEGMSPLAFPAYSDQFIEDGSFIRLQNVTVGYTFTTGTFKNVRVYVSGDNLFVLTKYTGYDPEVNTFTGYALGVDYTNYPKARTFTLGLSLGL
ncbi:MAG: SusC/RagA family TonB-linked outer membrane protein [Fidelibacterota bacterium]